MEKYEQISSDEKKAKEVYIENTGNSFHVPFNVQDHYLRVLNFNPLLPKSDL